LLNSDGALHAALSEVRRSARLVSTVVTGRGALVDRGATLEDSIVMPGHDVGSRLPAAASGWSARSSRKPGAPSRPEEAFGAAEDFLSESLTDRRGRPAGASRAAPLPGQLLRLASAPFSPPAPLAVLARRSPVRLSPGMPRRLA
jgi:hypothetical protein